MQCFDGKFHFDSIFCAPNLVLHTDKHRVMYLRRMNKLTCMTSSQHALWYKSSFDAVAVNPGRFGPESFWPESFRPGSFRPILGVGRFGLGRWVVSANFLGESIRP